MKLLFDIGGTTTRLGIASGDNHIDNIITYPTPQDYKVGIDSIALHAKELSLEQSIGLIAGGIAGGLSIDKTSLTHGGNIQEWVGKNLVEDLQNAVGAKTVILENDTAMAGLGEALFGAGKNHSNILYLAIGTGVGGAWINNGKLITTKYGFEPGHQFIDYENRKSLQDLISGKALANWFDKSVAEVSSEEIWDEIAEPLVAGLFNSFMHWPSDIIVLGGGVILGHDFPLEEINEALHERMPSISPFPPVVRAELGDYPALYGALSNSSQ